MQCARNGPWMDEDPVGPRHWVAGGPVGHKHGMRDGKRGRDQEESVAKASEQPQESGKLQGHGEFTLLGDGMWQGGRGRRGVSNQGTRGDR